MLWSAALVALGFACWWVSTLGAGGGAILFLPIARLVLEPVTIPIVIAVASAISSVQRCWLYRHDIDTPIFLANLPGLVVGGAVGVGLLRGIPPAALSIIVGLFLSVFALSRMVGRRKRAIGAGAPWQFTLASFATAALSAVVGASGPTMNPFYLRAGILKEAMIGTKAASSLAMQVVKGSAFAAIGMLTPEIAVAGLWVGLGAVVGNWLGKRTLGRLSGESFERIVHVALLVSGLVILARAAEDVLAPAG